MRIKDAARLFPLLDNSWEVFWQWGVICSCGGGRSTVDHFLIVLKFIQRSLVSWAIAPLLGTSQARICFSCGPALQLRSWNPNKKQSNYADCCPSSPPVGFRHSEISLHFSQKHCFSREGRSWKWRAASRQAQVGWFVPPRGKCGRGELLRCWKWWHPWQCVQNAGPQRRFRFWGGSDRW